MGRPGRWIGHAAAIALAALAAAPLTAETPAELDRLSLATDQPDTGVALARQQIAAGDLLDALATLERVLFAHPESDEARLLHAGLLCRLDDRRGAILEFEGLGGRDIPDRLWAEAKAPCAAGRGG